MDKLSVEVYETGGLRKTGSITRYTATTTQAGVSYQAHGATPPAALYKLAMLLLNSPKTPITDSSVVAIERPEHVQTRVVAPNTYQVGGEHYAAEYQHWDWVADVYGAAYFVGTITKYITRWRKKNGVDDLRKAVHYHHKLVDLIKAGKLPMTAPVDDRISFQRYYVDTLKFFRQHPDLGELEYRIFALAYTYQNLDDLETMYLHIDALIHKAKQDSPTAHNA